MTRNVTIRIDEDLLRTLRHRAVDEQMSLSGWVVSILRATVEQEVSPDSVRQRALQRLNEGFHLGGQPLKREETHVR